MSIKVKVKKSLYESILNEGEGAPQQPAQTVAQPAQQPAQPTQQQPAQAAPANNGQQQPAQQTAQPAQQPAQQPQQTFGNDCLAFMQTLSQNICAECNKFVESHKDAGLTAIQPSTDKTWNGVQTDVQAYVKFIQDLSAKCKQQNGAANANTNNQNGQNQ